MASQTLKVTGVLHRANVAHVLLLVSLFKEVYYEPYVFSQSPGFVCFVAVHGLRRCQRTTLCGTAPMARSGQINQPAAGERMTAWHDVLLADWVGADNQLEIAVNQFGSQRASSQEVKDFAQQMIRSHSEMAEKLNQAVTNSNAAAFPRAGQIPYSAGYGGQPDAASATPAPGTPATNPSQGNPAAAPAPAAPATNPSQGNPAPPAANASAGAPVPSTATTPARCTFLRKSWHQRPCDLLDRTHCRRSTWHFGERPGWFDSRHSGRFSLEFRDAQARNR